MEYVNGPSLKKYIDQCGILPIHEAIYFTRMICEAINELHCMKDKIIHRDLKPENILLSKDLIELKLIDFGISSVKSRISNKNTKNLLTNEDAIFGTYPYLCPDILQITKKSTEYEKSKIISEQLDIFPVGVMLYEMVSGEKPFAASDYENKDVISLPLYYDVPPISEFNSTIPKIIDNIIFKCIASKPDDIKYRYKNIQELINDLDSVETMKNVTTLPLIKPLNKRVLQYKKIFDIEKQKHKRKYFEE
jgi:serine/threonine-protein kinase